MEKSLQTLDTYKKKYPSCKTRRSSRALVLDGEVMSENFPRPMKQVHRKGSADAQDAVLHLFDFIPLEDFKKR